MRQVVALFTRAWIEIYSIRLRKSRGLVALFTRAWIEIKNIVRDTDVHYVALFTRAWIEITILANQGVGVGGRPLHEGVD